MIALTDSSVIPAGSPLCGPANHAPTGAAVPGECWLDDLRREATGDMRWVWDGYLAPGNVTVLTSQWKAGKTTLLSVLLARMNRGGCLAGLGVALGKAAVVSEEAAATWLSRADKLAYGNHICWFCRPFAFPTKVDQWLALRDRIVDLHDRVGLSLVVIDPLAAFLPAGGENSATRMFEFLSSFRPLMSANVAVLLLHHPSKRDAGPGMAARGTGVLSSSADILIEMRWYGRPSDKNRRRRLLGFSRHDATPRQRVIELSPDGTDYVSHGDFGQDEFANYWQVLLGVLEVAREKLTRAQIVNGWPPDFAKPKRTTLRRWLDRAVDQGLLKRDGTGWKHKPYRYWLPGQEKKWPEGANDFDDLMNQIEAAQAHVLLRPSQLLPRPVEE